MIHGTIQGDMLKIGDNVTIRPDVAGTWKNTVFTVDKLLTKNVEIVVIGSTQRLRCRPHLLVKADDSLAATMLVQIDKIVTTPVLYNGTLVMYKDSVYVVIGSHGFDNYRIIKLGGNNGKYYRNISAKHVTIIEPEKIASILALLTGKKL